MEDVQGGDQMAPGAEAMRLALLLANEEALPVEVGRLSWTAEGKLSFHQAQERVRFSFLFRGLPFTAELEQEDATRLLLAGDLGSLPFTAEHPGHRRLLKRIAAATCRLPRGGIEITSRQELRLTASAAVPEKATPIHVIATTTALLLDFVPFLDLAEKALGSQARPGQLGQSPL